MNQTKQQFVSVNRRMEPEPIKGLWPWQFSTVRCYLDNRLLNWDYILNVAPTEETKK